MNTTYIVIAAIGVIVLLAWFFFSNSGKNAEELIENIEEKEDVPNDKIIVAENICIDELKKVIQVSCGFYNNEEFLVSARLTEVDEKTAVITFPFDVDFDVFCYFVNCIIYAHYTKHEPVIKSWATISANEGEFLKDCYNQKAIFYIPEDDEDKDNVYFTTENNKCFKLGIHLEELTEIPEVIHHFEHINEKYINLQNLKYEDFK